MTPLAARLQPWMEKTLQSEEIHHWLREFGSPLNLIQPEPLTENIAALDRAAEEFDVDFRVFFARKANKCLSLVDAAHEAGAGIDIASLNELQQVLARGVPGEDIICTAAIKDERLLKTCTEHGVTIAIDNRDEWHQLNKQVENTSSPTPIALRLSGFDFDGQRQDSRFGIDLSELDQLLAECQNEAVGAGIRIVGIHFHLDGYSAPERVFAIRQCLPIVDQLRVMGHPVAFLDMGGGIPMSYLDDESQWDTFWQQLHQAVLKQSEPITFNNHGLGYLAVDGQLYGRRACYPYFQTCVQDQWLRGVLEADCGETSIAAAIGQRKLQLRCEPGRSVLDGCGMTVAKVVFRKQNPAGHWFIGLSMNTTQCRTSSDDFLVDPILVPSPDGSPSEPIDGYLVGAYCTESELISLRRFQFPSGVRVGDLVALPNTAGYLMHFRESRSHQFPLAKNVVTRTNDPLRAEVDPIDC